MAQIRVTLSGMGGTLDCRTMDADKVETFDAAIREMVMDIALNAAFAVGDKITIEEID